jgi:glycosyltransferase involved in cell wall biosynthesis
MRVCIALDHRFLRRPDGSVWTRTVYPYKFWEQYLSAFTSVKVLARVERFSDAGCAPLTRADGDGVTFLDLPHFVGVRGYLRSWLRLRQKLRGEVDEHDALLFRAWGHVSSACWSVLVGKGRPYGLEVVNDPREVVLHAGGLPAVRHLLASTAAKQLAAQCLGGSAVSYVTEKTLQERYPPAPGAVVASYSSVDLAESFFAKPKTATRAQRKRILTVAPLHHMIKGVDILLRALSQSLGMGTDAQLVVVGEGRCKRRLQTMAGALGIAERVVFAGETSGPDGTIPFFDETDLFVLPSRSEGLPRSLVEAMARGLPCVATNVGGIPELLPASDMVPRNDALALARLIHCVLADSSRLNAMASRSFEKALEFSAALLQKKRIGFYRSLYEVTSQCSNTMLLQ